MRPQKGDYAAHYESYIKSISENDPVAAMFNSKRDTLQFFNQLNTDIVGNPYAEGKWSFKETLGHIIDTERIMAYRALSIGRGETKHLPGFDHDAYVDSAAFNKQNLSDLLMDYSVVRESSIILFRSFGENELSRRGIASENEVTVLALGYIIAGHNRHHLSVLQSNYQRNL